MSERVAIEQALEKEHRTTKRQTLLKRLWKVNQRIDDERDTAKDEGSIVEPWEIRHSHPVILDGRHAK